MALDSTNCEVWPINRAAGCWDIPDTVSEATITQWQRVASEYLWAMTGRRLGPSCRVTVRPCRKRCADDYGIFSGRFLNQGQYQSTGGYIPYMRDGRMYNATLCGCVSDCHCGPELCQVDLPGPVYDIVEVSVDGAVVPSDTYSVYDGRYLTRVQNGPAAPEGLCWPTCQDMTRSLAMENTFGVTYRTGLNLSGMATMAVTELTAHFIRGCNGGCGCGAGTQQNLQRVSRQGVDLEFLDVSQVLSEGKTGIPLVDQFVYLQNPLGLGSTLRVLSPDAPRPPRIWGGIV